MDLTFSERELRFRDKLRGWLAGHDPGWEPDGDEDVHCSSEENILGGAGNGWKFALTTLMNERAGLAFFLQVRLRQLLDRLIGHAAAQGWLDDLSSPIGSASCIFTPRFSA